MRKVITHIALFILCLAIADSALARRWHNRVGVGVVVAPPLWGPWYQPPVVYHSYQPVVIERHAPVYVEQPPVYVEQPPVYVEQQPRTSGYWYFCQLPGKYYPEITECPGGWIKVPPRP